MWEIYNLLSLLSFLFENLYSFFSCLVPILSQFVPLFLCFQPSSVSFCFLCTATPSSPAPCCHKAQVSPLCSFLSIQTLSAYSSPAWRCSSCLFGFPHCSSSHILCCFITTTSAFCFVSSILLNVVILYLRSLSQSMSLVLSFHKLWH